MTKLEIAKKISTDLDLTRTFAEKSVDTIIDAMKEALTVEKEAITIRRFGTFSIRAKRERVGRNPKTGVEAVISQRKVVQFKPGETFKHFVNENEL